MSGIAAILNVPAAPEELALWATSHASHHRDIIRRIFELTGQPLNEFILDPIDPNDTDVWEAQHQIMHQQMDTILGISGFDLSQVDFSKPELLDPWVQLNFQEHLQASNILEIG